MPPVPRKVQVVISRKTDQVADQLYETSDRGKSRFKVENFSQNTVIRTLSPEVQGCHSLKGIDEIMAVLCGNTVRIQNDCK